MTGVQTCALPICAEEGELDSGCGHSWLFRQYRPWKSDATHPETSGRSKGTAADPEMVESGSIGGWGVVGDEGGDSARGGDLAAFSEHLPILRTRPMGDVVAQAIRVWGLDRSPLRG